jgi:hypothetical protein
MASRSISTRLTPGNGSRASVTGALEASADRRELSGVRGLAGRGGSNPGRVARRILDQSRKLLSRCRRIVGFLVPITVRIFIE